MCGASISGWRQGRKHGLSLANRHHGPRNGKILAMPFDDAGPELGDHHVSIIYPDTHAPASSHSSRNSRLQCGMRERPRDSETRRLWNYTTAVHDAAEPEDTVRDHRQSRASS